MLNKTVIHTWSKSVILSRKSIIFTTVILIIKLLNSEKRLYAEKKCYTQTKLLNTQENCDIK